MEKAEHQNTDTVMGDWFVLGQLLDKKYQNKGYKNRDDINSKKEKADEY